MTRLLHVADLHISEARRPEDTIRMLGEISVLAHEKQCQGVIISGDVFDRASTPEERLIFAEFVSDLRHGSITVAVVPGNHDARKDLDLFSYSGARVLRLGEAERIGAVCVAGLPWVDRVAQAFGCSPAAVMEWPYLAYATARQLLFPEDEVSAEDQAAVLPGFGNYTREG